MSNRTIFLLVVASAVSIFALWLVWKDGSHYVAMATRDDTTADTTLTACPLGRAEFVKADSPAVKFTGRLSGENIFSKDSDENFPAEIDAFFACADLNWNAKTGERTPWAGEVLVRGKKFSCRECWDGASKQDIGTVPAGGTFDITVSTDEPKKADSLAGSFRFYESGYKKPPSDGFIEWEEATASTNPYYIIPDSMIDKIITPNCNLENGDVSYLVKINDTTFVMLRLPAERVEPNTEFMDRYFTRVKR